MDLARKLQLKPDMSVAVVGAPDQLAAAIIGETHQADPESAGALIVFVRDAADLDAASQGLVTAARREALTWVAYPKAGQLGTDLNRDSVRETLEPRGARTVRQVALDDLWSALRLRAG